MDYAWIVRGLCMDYAWIMHGLCMDYAWIMLGLRMGYAWIIHGLRMDYAWIMNGLCMADSLEVLKKHRLRIRPGLIHGKGVQMEHAQWYQILKIQRLALHVHFAISRCYR